jgi:hypothetical protein
MVGQMEVRSRERVFFFPGALKIYINIWEGKNLVIPNHQYVISGERHGWFLG